MKWEGRIQPRGLTLQAALGVNMRMTRSLVFSSLLSVLLLPAAGHAISQPRLKGPSADISSFWQGTASTFLSFWRSALGFDEPDSLLKGRGTMDPNGGPAQINTVDPGSTDGRGTMDPNG